MILPDLLASLPAWFGVGAGSGAGFFTLKWLIEWIGGRMDRRADALDKGTQRLIEGLESRLNAVTARLDKVEQELAECTKKHAESEAKSLRLEAMLQGAGDARQHAQLIIAADKGGRA